MDLPRISIVTPSLNQGQYLEQTIRSVLNQQYPNLEYIVIDGGSTDNSGQILEKYRPLLARCIVEPDRGQGDALAKGFALAEGDIFCWLCSDDMLKPGVLWLAAGAFQNNPSLDLLYGDTEYLYADGTIRQKPRLFYDFDVMLYAFNLVPQPSAFFSRRAYVRAGGVDPSMNYAMDYDLFLRMGREAKVAFIPLTLSSYRLHGGSKTVSQAKHFSREWKKAREKVLGRPLTLLDRGKWYVYTAKVVWKFFAERGLLKLSYDRSKYQL